MGRQQVQGGGGAGAKLFCFCTRDCCPKRIRGYMDIVEWKWSESPLFIQTSRIVKLYKGRKVPPCPGDNRRWGSGPARCRHPKSDDSITASASDAHRKTHDNRRSTHRKSRQISNVKRPVRVQDTRNTSDTTSHQLLQDTEPLSRRGQQWGR